mmetsp:Transcript_15885/g.28211  ORF Transcript_15885/g.28211 Transcript_15885/m.28211 type:complete len:235 (+) Transcript_15885:388-1092(+)
MGVDTHQLFPARAVVNLDVAVLAAARDPRAVGAKVRPVHNPRVPLQRHQHRLERRRVPHAHKAVAASGEARAVGAVSQAKDAASVALVRLHARPLRRPQLDGAVHGAGGDPAAVRTPRQAAHLCRVPGQRRQTLAGSRVPNLDRLVHAATRQPLALVVPARDGYVLLVRVNLLQLLPRRRVPQPDRGRAAARDVTPIRTPLQPGHSPAVTRQPPHLLVALRVEEADKLIVRRGR